MSATDTVVRHNVELIDVGSTRGY